MIKLFKVKEKQRELAENASGGAPVKKQSAGELRLHKGFLLFIKWNVFACFVMAKFVWHCPPLFIPFPPLKQRMKGKREKGSTAID